MTNILKELQVKVDKHKILKMINTFLPSTNKMEKFYAAEKPTFAYYVNDHVLINREQIEMVNLILNKLNVQIFDLLGATDFS